MPDLAPCQGCACSAAAETPRTLAAQRALGPVTPRAGDLETLALLGTQLSDAVISTNNGAALISGQGGYGAFQCSTSPFSILPKRITLRVAGYTDLRLFTTPDHADRLSLIATAPDGEILHRVTVQDAYDQRVLMALEPHDGGSLPQFHTTKLASNVVSLPAIHAARKSWAQSNTAQHLNDLLGGGGVTRAQTLPHLGSNRAFEVICQTLPSFLSHLATKGIAHARLVPAGGMIQGDLVHGSHISLAGRILVARGPRQHFALDLDQVASAWVTRFDKRSQLELYDHQNRAIAVIAPGDANQLGSWNTLLASLPPRRSGAG